MPQPTRRSRSPGRTRSSASSSCRRDASARPPPTFAARSACSPATSTPSTRSRRSRRRAGSSAHATILERRAVETIPLPQFVGLYGDLLHVTGHERAARVQYATEDGIRRLLESNGVRTDLETALFDVDHGIRLEATLALARKAQRERPSIDGADVLAWALERTGRCGEALHYSNLALRLGTQDAAKFFHRAMIERCLGHAPAPWARRAAALNPSFSLLWAPTLKRMVQS